MEWTHSNCPCVTASVILFWRGKAKRLRRCISRRPTSIARHLDGAWTLLFEPTVLSQNGHDKTEHTLTAQNERTHFSSMGDTVHAHAPRYRTGLSAFTRQGGKCRNCTGIGIYLKRHGCASAYSRTVLPRMQARQAKHCCAQARARLLAHHRAGGWDQNFHEPAVVAWRGCKL